MSADKIKSEKTKGKLVLNLRAEFECSGNILDDLDSLKEIVEAARGYATLSGFIEIDGKNVGDVS